MIRILVLILFFIPSAFCKGQITLDECRMAAQMNYPLIRQYNLIQLAEQYTLTNAGKGNLPQISLNGKFSYQSDATTFPFNIPGIGIKGLPKDQYQIMIEIQQNIWDGGKIHYQKEQARATSQENEHQLDVSMYALNQQVNQIFFGILLLDEQLNQNTLLESDLLRNLKTIEAYRSNGIANDADVDAVKVEILNTKQQQAQLSANREAYLRMLALLTGKQLSTKATLVRPHIPDETEALVINRPELKLYMAQEQTIKTMQRSLQANYMPRLGIFAQGAYGNPGLDMLKDKFTTYYVVGARLTWNFGSLYTLKNNKRKLETQRKQIQNNRDLFLLNTQLQLAEQDGNISTLRKQMEKDDEIIRLRTNIRKSAEAKVANGTLTVTEMLREVTAESMARQTKALHEIQLLQNLYQKEHLINSQLH